MGKHEKFLFNADLNLASSPVVNMSTSVGHGPYALGYQTAFDSGKSALTKHNLALAYNAGDMILHATATDSKVFGGGVYLKNSSKLETCPFTGNVSIRGRILTGIVKSMKMNRTIVLRRD